MQGLEKVVNWELVSIFCKSVTMPPFVVTSCVRSSDRAKGELCAHMQESHDKSCA